MSERQRRPVERVRSGLGRRSGECGATAAEGDVEAGEVGGDGAGAGGSDDSRLGLLEKPLDGLSVGLVPQFSGQLENPRGTRGGHSDSAAAAVNFGVPVLGGALGRVGCGLLLLLLLLLLLNLVGLVGEGVRSGGDGEGGVDEVGRGGRSGGGGGSGGRGR